MIEHRTPIRVYYEDTDAGGIVYHARYLHFAERARTETLRDAGLDHAGLRDRFGVVFVAARLEIAFRRPARLDDLLAVVTAPEAVGGASLDLRQTVLRGEEVLAGLRVRLGLIGALDGRPRRLPAELRAVFAAA